MFDGRQCILHSLLLLMEWDVLTFGIWITTQNCLLLPRLLKVIRLWIGLCGHHRVIKSQQVTMLERFGYMTSERWVSSVLSLLCVSLECKTTSFQVKGLRFIGFCICSLLATGGTERRRVFKIYAHFAGIEEQQHRTWRLRIGEWHWLLESFFGIL